MKRKKSIEMQKYKAKVILIFFRFRDQHCFVWGPLKIKYTFSIVKAVSEVAYGIVKMAAETSLEEQDVTMEESTPSKEQGVQKMFTLKKWNAVAMWSWDVECDTCAICRVQVMGQFLLSIKLNRSNLHKISFCLIILVCCKIVLLM